MCFLNLAWFLLSHNLTVEPSLSLLSKKCQDCRHAPGLCVLIWFHFSVPGIQCILGKHSATGLYLSLPTPFTF